METKIDCPYGYDICNPISSDEKKIAASLAGVIALIEKTKELERELKDLRKEIDNLKLKIN